MKEYLAFVVKSNLNNGRVRQNAPGQVIHADDAELAMQEAKMLTEMKAGEKMAVAFIRDLTPQDVPDRYRPAENNRWEEEFQMA